MTRRVRIGVVDYGAGNLVSIDQALTAVGAEVQLVREPEALRGIDALIVPGVGAARPAMDRLQSHGLVEPIRAWLAADRPFLGICLGLQLLFETSEEDGAETLGVLPGRTVAIADAPTLPHIGWNQVERTRSHPLFEGIEPAIDFYFVHSYAGAPRQGPDGATDDLVLATTEHGGRFTSAVARGSMLGVQFHPERSGRDGLRLLANFVGLVGMAA
ncbi:MAG TPA: imidazole glycerol phosphate synthase subunit HisH [Candidatus Limnocylindrales bacterium]|jgi:imidazole glycerol phosphate synthase glutamine amidotransferase subunit|nr:imidazole glycerol phosphate synthase subunit HisH [Candidatus Limnocylindrales bacterium]